jgi:hypothetical protein
MLAAYIIIASTLFAGHPDTELVPVRVQSGSPESGRVVQRTGH